jgi:hypothetical protein
VFDEAFTAHDIPHSLAPFFQEYPLDDLDVEHDRWTIIEQTLRWGNRAELRWLFRRYQEHELAEWVHRWGDAALPHDQLPFWRLLLGIEALG